MKGFVVTGGTGGAIVRPSVDTGDNTLLLQLQKPDTTNIFRVSQGGYINFGGSFDGAMEGDTWYLSPSGLRRKGIGGPISIDCGTGGAYLDLKGYAVRIYDHTGALHHTLGNPGLGFNGAAPVAQSTGWNVTNVTTDKTFDANATTLDELADVVGTLIDYLKSRGDLGA